MDSSVALLRSISNGSARSLDIAVRSLFESDVARASVASVVAGGALSRHWNGLFQYAAIRVGANRATRMLGELRTWFEESAFSLPTAEAEDLLVRPSAALYQRLHARLATVPQRTLAADAPEWWVPAEEHLAACTVRLRDALTKEQAEVLELCYSRGLDPAECALVLDIPVGEVEKKMLVGALAAEKVISPRARRQSVTKERLLLQAFALDLRRAKAPPRPSRDPVLTAGTLIQERYEIEALLGAGAFADVYRARDRDVTGHVVALKILRRAAADPQSVRSALRELQLIASVFHPSVVQLKDHGWYDGHLWFVMPLYRGETLAQRLERGPLTRQQAREIFEVLAEALATMHRAGVRHQDIKPENVFLANIGGETGTRVLPVLLDLGVAAKDVELVLAGTPAYFAPEVAARFSGMPDPPAVGPKADVFSLALTLRDALDPTPRDYVAAAAVDAFVSFRARNSPRPPFRRDLKDLAPSFERWLHRSPDTRPSSEEFRQQLSVLTRPAERRARRASLLRWLVPSLLAVATLFGSVVYFLSKDAAVHRVEAKSERDRATRASEWAASMHASLEAEEALRRQLEIEVANLESRYQNSRFTREQLAARLASVEGEAKMLDERRNLHLAKLRRENADLMSERERHQATLAALDALRERKDDLARELDRTKAALDEAKSQKADLEAQNDLLMSQVQTTKGAIDDMRARVADLLGWAKTSEAPVSSNGGLGRPPEDSKEQH
jgi:eukaryotic-like serine/threonine-protein kinase